MCTFKDYEQCIVDNSKEFVDFVVKCTQEYVVIPNIQMKVQFTKDVVDPIVICLIKLS